MTPEGKRRFAALTSALAVYAAGCTPATPEPQHTAFADLPKHNVPRSQDTPESFVVPRPTGKRSSRSRPARPARSSSAEGGTGCSLETIKRLESGGNYQAQNPTSTASGAYQVLRSTWNNYGGYPTAASAPPEVQDQFAAELYARSGSRPWVVCR